LSQAVDTYHGGCHRQEGTLANEIRRSGAGLWHPEANKLALVRQEIDSNSHRLKAVLNEEGLRREFFGGVDDEEGAVKAFVSQNKESALKTKPMVS
jgi:hypothetical protein